MQTKKILVFMILGLFMVSMVSGVVSGNFLERFFDAWNPEEGTKLEGLDAKIILLVIIFLILLMIINALDISPVFSFPLAIIASFLFTFYVAPNQILGIFRSYSPLALAFATSLPLLVLFAVMWISVKKEDPTLMVVQFLGWLLFLVYSSFRLVLHILKKFLGYYGFLPDAKEFISKILGQLSDIPQEQEIWWLISTIAIIIVCSFMVFKNSWVLRTATKTLGQIKEVKMQQNLNKEQRGRESLRKTAEGSES